MITKTAEDCLARDRAGMEKYAFGVPSALKTLNSKAWGAERLGMGPLGIAGGAYSVSSGHENIPGVVGGTAGMAGAQVATDKIGKSKWLTNLASKVPGKWGKALGLAGKAIGGLAVPLLGYSAGANVGRKLGKPPKMRPGKMVGKDSKRLPRVQPYSDFNT